MGATALKPTRRHPETPTVTTLEEAAAVARVDGHPLQAEAYACAVKVMEGALMLATDKVVRQIGRRDLWDDVYSEAVLSLWGLLKSFKPGAGCSASSYIITYLTHHTRKTVMAHLPVVRIPQHALESGTRVYATSIDTPDDNDEDTRTFADTMIAPGRSPEQQAMGNQIIERMLQGRDAGMLVAMMHGFSRAEIGSAHGMSGERVSQIIGHVKMNLSYSIK